MERTFPMRRSSRNHRTHRLSLVRAGTVICYLCIVPLSIPAVGICASASSHLPLLMEAPNDIPPGLLKRFLHLKCRNDG